MIHLKRILPIIVISQFCCTSLWFASNAVLIDLIASFTLNTNALQVKGKPIKISRLNGIAIYTNIKRRFMSIDLKKGPLINYNEGTIKIIYKSRPGEKKQSIFAESILAL